MGGTVLCGSCGGQSPAAAAACANCGRPLNAGSATPASAYAPVEGQVTGLQTRSEPGLRNQNQMVWTFRVERYDAAGNQLALVPVELRGLSIEGSIHDGDRVRVHGKRRDGTLRAKTVENLTTGAVVRAADLPGWAIWTAIAILIVIVAFIGWVAFRIITSDDGPPDDFPFPTGLVTWLLKT